MNDSHRSTVQKAMIFKSTSDFVRIRSQSPMQNYQSSKHDALASL